MMANEENKNKDHDLLTKKNNNNDFSYKELLKLEIKNQNNLKEIILSYMTTFAYSDSKIPYNMVDSVIEFLRELKQALTYCDENIDKLNLMKKESETKDLLNSYNNILMEILQKNIIIEQCIYKSTKMSDFNFNKKSSIKEEKDCSDDNRIIENNIVDKNTVRNNDTTESVFSENKSKDSKNKKKTEEKFKEKSDLRRENCLIISEIRSKDILPYSNETLNKELQNNPKKYSSIDEIIEKKYTIPLTHYKNPFVARFREAFRLMRIKEKSSIAKAFDLGMELAFNYNLHPAIISACRNLDELDIYLDCLENEETDKFKCFDIVFEIPPMIVKRKSNIFDKEK